MDRESVPFGTFKGQGHKVHSFDLQLRHRGEVSFQAYEGNGS